MTSFILLFFFSCSFVCYKETLKMCHIRFVKVTEVHFYPETKCVNVQQVQRKVIARQVLR